MKNVGILTLAMLIAMFGMAGTASAQCIDNLADGLGPASDTVEIGETIEYTISLSVPASPAPPSPPNCTLVNVDVYFFPPPLGSPEDHPCDSDPGLGVLIDSGLTLVPGAAPYVYTSADNAILSYVAQAGDAGQTVFAHMATYFNTEDNPTGPALCDEKESAVDVGCPEPCIEITKTVDCEWSKVGDWVTYTICVENCGELFDLTNVVVTDDLLGGSLGFPSTIGPGETVCLDFDYQIQPGDDTGLPGATVVNTASVSAEQFCGDEITPVGDDSDPVVVTLLHPELEVTKTCMTPFVPVGGEAEFEIVITNMGDVALDITTDEPEIAPFTLDADSDYVQTVTRTCEEASVYNGINVHGTIPPEFCALPNEYFAFAEDSCECVNPCIDVTKEVDCDISKVGDWVTYTICIENCSDPPGPLYNVTVVDDVLGDLTGAFPTELAEGEIVCLDFDYQIQPGDDNGLEYPSATLVNTVEVNATNVAGFPAPPDQASATVYFVHPGVTVTKTCLTPVVPVGGDAEFEIVITNVGDIELNITTDELEIPPFTLDPFSEYTQVVTRPCVEDLVHNGINVLGTIPPEYCELPNEYPAFAEDSCECAPPCLEITKDVDCDISKVGDEVLYEICVYNCGIIDLYNVVVTDPLLGGVLPEFSSMLPAGATECHTYPYVVQPADLNPLVNTAEATGETEFGFPVGPVFDDAEVDLIHPSLTVSMDCLTDPVPPGGDAQFEIIITNDGDCDLIITAVPPLFPGSMTLADGDVLTVVVTVPDPGGVDEICYDVVVTWTLPPEYCEMENTDDVAADACCPIEGEDGCTPGFWKNHPDCWCDAFDPEDRVDSVFTVPSELSGLADDTLMDALNYGGGGQVIGAARNLLRSAVSALLNACSTDVAYPMSVAAVIDAVNTALATLDRGEILALHSTLDMYNNYGCSIDAHCRPIVDEPDDGPRGPQVIGEVVGDVGGFPEEKEGTEQLPTKAAVSQSAPNPFRDTARIQFQIPSSGAVAIDVYDVSGRHVVSLMDEKKPAGYHDVVWDGRNTAGSQVPAGVYFYRVRLEDETLMEKMILVR